jgi:hypothetical protein
MSFIFGRVRRGLAELVRNPGRLARRHSRLLRSYKTFTNLVLLRKRLRLRRLVSTVSVASPAIYLEDNLGFKVLPPEMVASAAPLIARCRDLMCSGARRPMRKTHLESLAGPDEIARYPEFLDFCLDPIFLSAGARYLGDLPVLASVDFWHSRHDTGPFHTSQLYHRDLDDWRQFKVFLFVSDVDTESGPLTVLPAHVTERVCRELGYRATSGNFRITDDQIRSRLANGEEQTLTGPSGTIVLADTSRLLHFGSRVSGRDRYVVVAQYLTPTNFMRNPFFRVEPWPYAHLAHARVTPLQRAVLGEGV